MGTRSINVYLSSFCSLSAQPLTRCYVIYSLGQTVWIHGKWRLLLEWLQWIFALYIFRTVFLKPGMLNFTSKKLLFYAVNWNPHLQKWWNVLISFQGISFCWKAKTCTQRTVYRQVHIYLDRQFFFLLLLLYITTTNFKYIHIYLNLYIHNCYVCCCFWLCTMSLSVLKGTFLNKM